MSQSPDEMSDDASDDGIDRTDLLLSRCKPCSVHVERLNRNLIDYWLTGGPSKHNGDGNDHNGDGLNNDEGDDEDESNIVTIDLTQVNVDQFKRAPTIARSSSSKLPGKIFCLFNLEESDDRYEAIQIHYRELRYAPYKCWECDEATVEIKEMIDHYIDVHPDIKMMKYKEERVPAKEKWVTNFIAYQIACMNDEEDMLPWDIVNKYCPVCNQYDFALSKTKSKVKLKASTVLDKNHINKHLRYNPYECALCLKRGKKYALSAINKKARDHLIARHSILDPTEAELKKYFQPTGTIPELENFLRDYVGIIKENEKTHHKDQVATRKAIVGRPPGKGAGKKKQTGHLFTAATNSYKKMKESRRDSVKNGKIANQRTVTMEDNHKYEMNSAPLPRDEPSKILCIFCSEKGLSDIFSAWGHYGNHLKYMPIVCQICNKKFTGDTTFRYHGIEHVEYSDLPFTRNCDDVIESWGQAFLEGLVKDSEAKPEFSAFCPVCEKIFTKPVDIPHLSQSQVKKHVYSHLRYHPYECLKCEKNSSYVFDLENDGLEHLTNVHHMTASLSEIPQFFIKSRAIEALDKLLKDNFEKVQYLMGGSTINLSGSSTTLVTSSQDPGIEPNEFENLLSTLEETLGTSTLNNLLNTVTDVEQPTTTALTASSTTASST